MKRQQNEAASQFPPPPDPRPINHLSLFRPSSLPLLINVSFLSTTGRDSFSVFFGFLIQYHRLSAFEILCPSPVINVCLATMSSLSLIDSVIDDDDEFWCVNTQLTPRDLCTDHPTAPCALKSSTFPIRTSNPAHVATRYEPDEMKAVTSYLMLDPQD